ncbi:hypothetical protein AB1L42_10105 [Thalassoglobus sp. JC818]|uniref:hypothetical protein n=1 Tax=Thalassoglobus sp. JC818 TaxID=3232136 RepID=UPI00345A25D8
MNAIRIVLLLFVLVLGLQRDGICEARSIQSFNAVKEKWGDLVGTTWQIEGRYALMGSTSLKFVNCDMPFRFSSNVSRPSGQFKNLEVIGKIQKNNGRLFFEVNSLRKVPSDDEQYLARRARVDSDDPKAMYELADWAEERARFYGDEDLRMKAQQLKQNGLLIEYRQLETIDQRALDHLLKKAREFQLDESLVQEFLHRGYWEQFDQLNKLRDRVDRLTELHVSVARNLPGASTPLEQYPQELADKYFAGPIQLYDESKNPARRQLDRLFYLKVSVDMILAQADASGANGFAIAKRLKTDAPERADLIREYESKELAYASKRLDTMTRAEMLNLSNRYVDFGDASQAVETKRNWLASRESLARGQGARGLVDYAEDWIQLLDDREAAARFYIEAWKINPQYPLATEWLDKNGYALHEGNWTPKDLIPETRESQIETAIREGRIEEGMTQHQVKSAMGIAPDSIVRFASSGRVSELWIYDAAGVMIRFGWKQGDSNGQVNSISSTVRRGTN